MHGGKDRTQKFKKCLRAHQSQFSGAPIGGGSRRALAAGVACGLISFRCSLLWRFPPLPLSQIDYIGYTALHPNAEKHTHGSPTKRDMRGAPLLASVFILAVTRLATDRDRCRSMTLVSSSLFSLMRVLIFNLYLKFKSHHTE